MNYQEILETANFLKEKGFENAQIGIVLGTGLGRLIDEMEIEHSISYDQIPHFPVATVEFHKGKLLYGTIKGKKVIVMQGRFHFYEGYNMKEITFPIRVLKVLGIQQLLLSNAAGSMNPKMKKGELVLIDDHINLQPDNPLIGANIDELGPRFPDMSAPYNKEMNAKMNALAASLQISLYEGVYASVPGPNLETRAEYRYLQRIGADIVGMSTVPEVIVANHMSLPCIAVSVVTDECDPDDLHPVDIEEIIAVAGKAETKLIQLFVAYLEAV